MRFHTLLYFILLTSLFWGCKKNTPDLLLSKGLYIKTAPIPNFTLSQNIISLADGTFWIHLEDNTSFTGTLFCHYNSVFELIDSVRIKDNYQLSFRMPSDNQIVFPAFKYDASFLNIIEGNILTFNTNFKIIKSTNQVLQYQALTYYDPIFRTTQLTNGTIIGALECATSDNKILQYYDSAKITLAAYPPDLNRAPVWINLNPYWDYSNQIINTRLLDLANDGNDFYLLLLTNNLNLILRKHDDHGNLVWQKIIDSNYNNSTYFRIEQNRIIIYNYDTGKNLILNKSGEILRKMTLTNYMMFLNINNSDQYFATVHLMTSDGNFAEIRILDANFNTIKSKRFGSHDLIFAISAKQKDGTFICVSEILIKNQFKKLLFIKLDKNLNVIE